MEGTIRTFVAIKPDGVMRGLIGKIIQRFEAKGLKIIGLKMIHPTMEMATQHYAEHIGKPFYPRLVKYITSSPIIAMVIEGIDVIESVRHIVGATNPLEAQTGSIRADYSPIMAFNTIHASDSTESAEREIAIYFNEEEICTNWKTVFEILVEND